MNHSPCEVAEDVMASRYKAGFLYLIYLIWILPNYLHEVVLSYL
jgi:hypothetical protein